MLAPDRSRLKSQLGLGGQGWDLHRVPVLVPTHGACSFTGCRAPGKLCTNFCCRRSARAV